MGPQIVLAARRIDGEWHAALLVKGELDRTIQDVELDSVMNKGLAAFFGFPYPDDTRVQMIVNFSIPPAPKVEKS